MRNRIPRPAVFGVAAASLALAAGPVAAGPAGGLTGHQQRQALERVVMVCENDPTVVCPADPDDPGYSIDGFQFDRVLHERCGASHACVPLVVAERPATLTIEATELAPDPLASCSGDPECLNLDVTVGLDVPGAAAGVAIARSFAHPTGFLRIPYCQGDNDAPGVRISDWFPFRNRDCLFEDGINFEGMLLASNTPLFTPDGVAAGVDPKVLDFEAALIGYAEDELGIPPGSVLPVTLLDAPDPAKGLLAGNAVRLDPSDLFDESTTGGTRTGSYPLTVRFAVSARTPDTWQLKGSSPTQNDFFGSSVALDGPVAVVGQPNSEVGGPAGPGAAFVFRFDGTGWIPQGLLRAADATPYDYFGASVAVAGDAILVGAPLARDGAGVSQGAVYVFRPAAGSWVQEAKLLASDGAANDRFGSAVAATADALWIGAPSRANAGAVYVFGREGGGWSERQRLDPSVAGDFEFGAAVAISGDAAVTAASFGAPEVLPSGAAYVFRRSGTTWSEEARLLPADSGPSTAFQAVAMAGDTLLAGSPDAPGAAEPGAAYAFRRSGGVWSQEAKILAPPASPGSGFGRSVALDGESAIIGADPAERAYAFRSSGGSWSFDRAFSSAGSYRFGSAVAIGRDALLVASPYEGAGADSYEGRIHAFARPRATLVLTGTAQGGMLRLVVRGVVTEIPTAPGASAATVAGALATALAAQPLLGILRVFPVATQFRVELLGVDAADIAVSTTDAGLAAVLATACSNGADDDGDGGVDLADAGCADAQDVSERSPVYVCDDGDDNDGDLATDFPGDAGCASAVDASETPAVILTVSASQNDSGCAYDIIGNNSFGYYGFGSPPCGGAFGPARSRFGATATSAAISDTSVRLRVRAASASDLEYAGYDYLASFLGASFTLSVDAPAGQVWSVDLASLARGALVTYRDGAAYDAMATLEGAIAPFNVTIGPNAYSFTAPGWTTYVSTGRGGASACIPFEASRSDSAVFSGAGPGSFTVQVASVLRTYSGGNESAILFGLDDVLPDFYATTTADNYAGNPTPGCSGRVAANDGYDLAVTLRLPACADGVDNDGDARVDGVDPSCRDGNDGSEAPGCSDGLDDDQDGLTDFPSDPGCQTAATEREDPRCDDDLDNDRDGRIDWDGGASAGMPDPQCAQRAWRDSEATGCGLGAELVLGLTLLARWRRRIAARLAPCSRLG